MASKKSVSVENRSIRRVGVSWRQNPSKCVVEMRPPNWKWKLNFGNYDSEFEAMIARDYGAFLRVTAGEDDTSAGGFYISDDHPSVYEFKESLEIFESLEDSKVRCDEYKILHPRYYQQPKEKWSGDANPPHREFCKKARNDIAIAIGKFRKSMGNGLVKKVNFPSVIGTSGHFWSSGDNCYNHCQEMAQIDEQSVDGGWIHCQPTSSHFENKGEIHEMTPGWTPGENMKNKDTYPCPDNDQSWLNDVNYLLLPNDDGCFQDQTAMDTVIIPTDEMVCEDNVVQSSTLSLHESDVGPNRSGAHSHSLAATPNSISSKPGMVEKQFKSKTLLANGYHALSEHKQALLAARLHSERVKLDMAVQKSNKVKIANLRTIRDLGVISNDEFKQQVKEIMNL